MNTQERQDIIRAMPWVKELSGERPMCEGIKWSLVPLKYFSDENSGYEVPDKARCKNKARWAFRALRRSKARSGKYCQHHLMMYLRYCNDELARTEKFWKQIHIDT